MLVSWPQKLNHETAIESGNQIQSDLTIMHSACRHFSFDPTYDCILQKELLGIDAPSVL